MAFSRSLKFRSLALVSVVLGSASCSDDAPNPTTKSDAGDESSNETSQSSASLSGSSATTSGGATSKPSSTSSTQTTAPDAGDAGGAPLDAGDAGETDGSEAGIDERLPHDAILAGEFAPLVTLEAGTNPSGRVQLQSLSDGSTIVSLQAVGLEPNTAYGAHVHALPCVYDNGGGHYKIDPTITATEESNEIWPSFTTNNTGVGYGRVTVDHRVRGDALSVVIHGPDMSKFLCADLAPESLSPLQAEGSFAPFAAQEAIDVDIEGGATLVHDDDSTVVSLAVTGLDPSEEYMAHVHALPCNILDAGGHYKIDPTVTEALESNEVWPVLQLSDAGAAMGAVEVSHLTRLDAQSIVIHRQDGDTALKVACADLIYTGFESSVTEGQLQRLETTDDAGVPELEGEASMSRSLDGTTTIELSLEGLAPETDYGVHVHDMPCWLNSGGGHYKVDESVSAVVEENEIWLNVTSNDDGEAERTVTTLYVPRAEAQSLVVHAPGGARLGCIDLDL